MSQYPGQYPPPYQSGMLPYQVPGQQWHPIEELLAPAKRAGVLMLIVAGLSVVCAVCMGGIGALWEEILKNAPPGDQANVIQMEAQLGVSVRIGLFVVAGLSVFAAILFLLLGIFVRRGGGVSVYASMVLAVLAMIYLGLNALTIFPKAASLPPQTVIGATCFTLFGAGFCVLLMVWLLQAAGNIRRIRELKEYQQNYWAYAQQQQAGYPQQQPGAYPGYPAGAYPGQPPQGQPPAGYYQQPQQAPQNPQQPPQDPTQPPGTV